jgi:malonate-semialdehyde dehydrogenase (acetylating)/methylmalonate-semialdehyde dehydrogenase
MSLAARLIAKNALGRRTGAAASRPMSTAAPKVKLLINGKFVDSKTDRWIPVHDPATNEVVCMTPQATQAEMEAAAQSAQDAYATWKEVAPQQRVRVFLKYQQLIRDHMDDIAKLITKEQGKTLADARGDVFRGLEVVEGTYARCARGGTAAS